MHSQYLPLKHSIYTDRLQNTMFTKMRLEYNGILPDISQTLICVLGPNIPSAYGSYITRTVSFVLANEGFSIITAGGRGSMAIAHREFVKLNRPSYVVAVSGFEQLYPPENKDLYTNLVQYGAIISPFKYKTQAEPGHYTLVYDMLIQMADIFLIIEGRNNSQHINVAERAAKAGKPVFAFPGRVTDRLSDGTNYLIKESFAHMICDPDELVGFLSNSYQKIA